MLQRFTCVTFADIKKIPHKEAISFMRFRVCHFFSSKSKESKATFKLSDKD